MRAGWLCLAVAGSLVAGAAMANEVVEQREAAMKQLGRQMAAVKASVVDQKSPLADAAAPAARIREIAAALPAMFPEGSGADSRALPAVWTDRAGFEGELATLGELATRLETAAIAGDQDAAALAFGAIGRQSCGGCHEKFRAPRR